MPNLGILEGQRRRSPGGERAGFFGDVHQVTANEQEALDQLLHTDWAALISQSGTSYANSMYQTWRERTYNPYQYPLTLPEYLVATRNSAGQAAAAKAASEAGDASARLAREAASHPAFQPDPPVTAPASVSNNPPPSTDLDYQAQVAANLALSKALANQPRPPGMDVALPDVAPFQPDPAPTGVTSPDPVSPIAPTSKKPLAFSLAGVAAAAVAAYLLLKG